MGPIGRESLPLAPTVHDANGSRSPALCWKAKKIFLKVKSIAGLHRITAS
jgi:hypothetical protein